MKFQEALPDSQINDLKVSATSARYPVSIQSATGENLTKAAQIADRWKGYCEDLYCDEEGKEIELEYWEQEPPPLRSEVARAIRQTEVAKPQVLTRSQQNCLKQEERRYWTECTE